MWEEKFGELQQEFEFSNKKVNQGFSENDIELLNSKAQEMLGADLPQAYLDMLKAANGFEFNGFRFYGIDEELLSYKPTQHINGVIESNLYWYEVEAQKEYIFIGNSSISWYVCSKMNNEYYILDLPPGDIMETHSCLKELFEELLRTCLL